MGFNLDGYDIEDDNTNDNVVFDTILYVQVQQMLFWCSTNI